MTFTLLLVLDGLAATACLGLAALVARNAVRRELGPDFRRDTALGPNSQERG